MVPAGVDRDEGEGKTEETGVVGLAMEATSIPATESTPRLMPHSRSSSVIESFRGCVLSGMRVDKEELRKRLAMPKYLRLAVRNSIRFRDPNSGNEVDPNAIGETADADPLIPPETPMVVFINPRSGGRHGPELKLRLQRLIAEEQVAHSSTEHLGLC